jgi:signal transduction histidine kinase
VTAGAFVEFLRRPMPSKEDIAWPRWIPIGITLLAAGAAVVAIAEREPVWPPGVGDVLGLIAILAWGYCLFGSPPMLPFGVVVYGSVVGMMIVHPVRLDFSPMILTLLIGELAATTSARLSATFAVLSSGSLVALDVFTPFDGSMFWIVAIGVSWDIGFIFQSQMRMLEHERATAAARAERAAAEERQRISREVHDVVAHSLSITMLHLTAARHSLEDGDADVAEAVDALRDAERLGRQAMTDIRRTVGLLDGGGGTQPMPGVAEIAELVRDFRNAGMDVAYELRGDPSVVPQSAGLSLYRIAQESLSNAAKHAHGAQVRARLDLDGRPPRFTVWNSLPDRTAADRRDQHGSGLNGMRERSELMGGRFHAGLSPAPDGLATDSRGRPGWLVEVEFPFPGQAALDSGPSCAASGLLSLTGLPQLLSPKPSPEAAPKPAVGES